MGVLNKVKVSAVKLPLINVSPDICNVTLVSGLDVPTPNTLKLVK